MMTVHEAISLFLSVVACLASAIALWISIPLQRQQRREIEEARARRKTADVRVELIRGGTRGSSRLIVQNIGEGTARDVALEVTPPEGRISPLMSDFQEKLPAPELRSGDRVELIAAISGDSGDWFTAKWRWQDEMGNVQERKGRVSLQS